MYIFMKNSLPNRTSELGIGIAKPIFRLPLGAFWKRAIHIRLHTSNISIYILHTYAFLYIYVYTNMYIMHTLYMMQIYVDMCIY